MAYQKSVSSLIKRHKIWVFTICLSSVIFYLACNVSRLRDDTYSEVYDMQNLPNTQSNPGVNNIPYKGITFADTTVPADIANPADPIQAAEFAWKEFIALAWPAKENSTPGMSGYYRTHPSNTGMLGSTGSGGVTVFDTYFHRAELFPTYATGNGKVLPPPDALPNYDYGSANIVPAPGADLTLFNNLDEASEINIAFMYYTPFAIKADAAKNTANNASGFFSNKAKAQKNIEPAVLQNAASDFAAQEAIKASLMYEAKGNLVYFNYLKENGLNNIIPRRTAKNKAIGLIKNMTTDTTGAFNLPFGTIEIKATYRRYDSKMDDLKKFHWTKAIYYTEKKSGGVTTLIANNDTMLLLSLHIIQKTPNVPTFTFATFEHVDNEKGGFRFTNVNPQTYTPPYQGNIRALPDPGIITAKRQFPVPANIEQYNNNIQTLLRNQFGNDIVWANYKLIGVQTVPTNDPTIEVPKQQFFLSNFATETNNSLQFFQGGLTGPGTNVPEPDTGHVFVKTGNKYTGFTSGGCLGCHGSQGQFAGGDFSVIAANGGSFKPEAITPYPVGGNVFLQNATGFPLKHKPK